MKQLLCEKRHMKLLLTFIIILLAIPSIAGGCTFFQVKFSSEEQLQQILLKQLQETTYPRLLSFDRFEILSRTSDNSTETDDIQVHVEFLYNTAAYVQEYRMQLSYQGSWVVTELTPHNRQDWQDYPVAGVSLGQALDDMNGYQYESIFNNQPLNMSKTSAGHMISDSASLEEGLSDIHFSFIRNTKGIEESFEVFAGYMYRSGEGWVLQDRDVSVSQRISEEIPEDILQNAVQTLRISYEETEYKFSEMRATYYDVQDIAVDSENCTGKVVIFVHGETDLVYLEVKTTLEFRYSDGWYFYSTADESEVINAGYLNDTHLLTEEDIRISLLQRVFRYGFAEDIEMSEEYIRNLQIEEQQMLEQGKMQEVSYVYRLLFDMVTFTIRGRATYQYQYEEGRFQLYSMNGDIIETALNIFGDWYGVLPYQEGTLYIHVSMVPVTLDAWDNENVPVDDDGSETVKKYEEEFLKAIVWFAYDADDGQEIKIGEYTASGNCSSENLCRLRLEFEAWSLPCPGFDLLELTGYFDCGTNEIRLDMVSGTGLTVKMPEAYQLWYEANMTNE